jgi:hypothetical protein
MDDPLEVTYNPSFEDLLQHQCPKVAFFHIGKTAGTSIQVALSRYLSDTKIKLYEYHCYDANLRIADLASRLDSLPELSIVVSVREPLARWISAWNWDCYKLSIDHSFVDSWPELKASLLAYQSCPALVDGLRRDEPGAKVVANYGHMYMGHSWYLHSQIVSSFKECHMNVVTFEHLGQDLLATINQIRARFGYPLICSIDLPREKTDYQSHAVGFPFASVNELSSPQVDFMKDKILCADYQAIRCLSQQVGQWPMGCEVATG